jgi:hypothetical protein
MKHLMMLSLCVALGLPSLGCCWSHGHGYGSGYGGACSPGYCPPAGGAYGTPFGYAPTTQSAYYGATTATAGVMPYTPYAISPALPMTATINPLPTY